MKQIWQLETALEVYFQLGVYIGDENAIDVFHSVKKSDFKNVEKAMGMYGGHLGEPSDVCVALVLRLEDFDIDYFSWGGCMFVSERMRDAMALDPSQVTYFEVDDSESAPLPRSKKYQMMEPLIYEDLLDAEKSYYRMDSIPPPGEFGPHEIYKLLYRPDAAPTHDLFYDNFFATFLFCTDELVTRLFEAGCTGMYLTDPLGYRGGDAQRQRTPDGIVVFGEKRETTHQEYRGLLRVCPRSFSDLTELSEHEAYGCPSQERKRFSVQALPIFCETATAVKPSDGTFDDPPLRQHLKAFGRIGALYDLNIDLL